MSARTTQVRKLETEKEKRSRLGRRSRRTGANGENEVVALGRARGFVCARTLVQVRGGDEEAPDVSGLLPLRPEVKKQIRPNAMKAYAESAEAAKDGEIPIAFTHARRGKWMATLGAEDFLDLYRDAIAFRTGSAIEVIVGDEPCPPNDRSPEVPR